jgi:hypothetical protein
MSALSEQILAMQPRLLRTEYGGWLAVSPHNAPLSIGVFAWQADRARDDFACAARRWAEGLADYEPGGTLGGAA